MKLPGIAEQAEHFSRSVKWYGSSGVRRSLVLTSRHAVWLSPLAGAATGLQGLGDLKRVA